jgi:energy-coupling factor transporter transmembrane protein EcfT
MSDDAHTVTKKLSPPRETELTFLRLVPGHSVVHGLWAGTKLLVATVLALAVSIRPSWGVLATVWVLVAGGLFLARIPLGPWWFFVVLLIGGGTSVLGNAEPIVHLGPVPLSLGALADWIRLTLVGAVLVLSGALVGWTTPLGEIAPAVARLTRPLRALRLPVDEWIVALAVAIRCLPLLVDEIRTLAAARRLRAQDELDDASFMDLLRIAHDLLSTALVISIRRARDLADAVIARGGLAGAVADSQERARALDVVVFLGVTAVAAAAVFALPW